MGRRGRFFQAIDGTDVRMVQRCEDLRFALESRESIGITREGFGKDFQRNIAAEARVMGEVDLSHPAHPEERADLVGANARSRSNSHAIVWKTGRLYAEWATSGCLRC